MGIARSLRLAGLLALMATVAQAGPPESDEAVRKLADVIDSHLERHWQDNGITPAPRADDAEFLRRVSLHIGGTIPRAADVREFLNDDSPDKRSRLVAELLEEPGYITNFSTTWRRVMIPEADNNIQVRYLIPAFEMWLREKLAANTPYDDLVEELLTTSLTDSQRNAFGRAQQASPLAFYLSKEVKPENLAAATSRVFLGVRIECAQCHDHPFDTWEQEEFWGFAAFFSGIQRQSRSGVFGAIGELLDRRELRIPETDKVVAARYLGGDEPEWSFRVSPRQTLAEWITSSENPYFAKAAVNRVWAHFFGVGIVDPVDDFSTNNPPSHPELLDALAKEFVAQDYDLKFLIKAITASRAYQLTSRHTHPSQDSAQLFARMAVQGMSAEQLLGSLNRATGTYVPFQTRNTISFGGNDPRQNFLQTFRNSTDPKTEQPTTILQSLTMMNGRLVAQATHPRESATLAAVVDYPLFDTAERIEALYLAALSRKPTAEESKKLVEYVESGGPRNDSAQALGDVFWALLNSSEFKLIH